MAWNLHAIEQMQLRGRRRMWGVRNLIFTQVLHELRSHGRVLVRGAARRGVRDDAVDVDAVGASRVDEMYEIFYYTSHARPDEVPDPTNTRASQRR